MNRVRLGCFGLILIGLVIALGLILFTRPQAAPEATRVIWVTATATDTPHPPTATSITTPTPVPATATATRVAAATAPPPPASTSLPAPEPTRAFFGTPPPSDGYPAYGEESGAAGEDLPYHLERVFYATDRRPGNIDRPDRAFGRGRNPAGLTYGVSYVSIPFDHQLGELEAPSIWRLEFFEDPESHVVLMQVETMEKAAYFLALNQDLEVAEDKLFVFIHGYNVTFEDAARRTAQMSYDFRALGFEATPIFYSWPSRGSTARYPADEATVQWTERHLKSFLIDLVEQTDTDNITLIAHSMGNRALTEVYKELLVEQPGFNRHFRQIILAAPDIDADVFKDDIIPRIAPAAGDESPAVTLYASSDDRAIQASQRFHAAPRAGEAGEHIVVVSGLDTIDASGLDTSFIGHSFFAEVDPIIKDIVIHLRTGQRAGQRPNLQPVSATSGQYWRFRQ